MLFQGLLELKEIPNLENYVKSGISLPEAGTFVFFDWESDLEMTMQYNMIKTASDLPVTNKWTGRFAVVLR